MSKKKARKPKDGKFINPVRKTRPRSQALPGLEDRAIQPLEDIAEAYADVRDRRIELNKEEHELKANALKLMKKYDKTIYRHDGITIQVIEGEPDVKVKIKKPGDDEDDADELDAAPDTTTISSEAEQL